MSINVSKRNIGVWFNDRGLASVRVWAPMAREVSLYPEGQSVLSLVPENYGYWYGETDQVKPGTLYKIGVDDKSPLPDPVSLSQPRGVHKESAAVDLSSFRWTDDSWLNVPFPSYIIYELHTGTFTSDKNFTGIINKLDHLQELGVNAIEIMPVGQFPGARNWGYDGVYPFAVQHSYGGAHQLQQLVNACHAKGIAVILDVIYNHLGPEGNYLNEFGPYFTDKYRTPWGKALNFDDAWCDGVREYFIENALMWFRDFHIDALRMDAVHAIKDVSPTHIIKEIRERVHELSQATNRPYYLIAEMDLNNPVYINPVDKGGYGLDAQWTDEFHHALRVSSGQARDGYYADFNGVEHLAKSYNDAYVYDGQFSEHRKRFFGAKTSNPGHQFVVFSQNHDQVGNRMKGERTSTLASFEMCKLLAGAVMTSPFVPMLFMGEEWAETNPFLFFIDHGDKELAALVNKGRKEEFAAFQWNGEPPDPRLEETFQQSMLQWNLLSKEQHQIMFRYYQQLIRLRRSHPALRSTDRSGTRARAEKSSRAVYLERSGEEQQILCVLNFSEEPLVHEMDGTAWKILLDSASAAFGGKVTETRNCNEIEPQSIRIYLRTEN